MLQEILTYSTVLAAIIYTLYSTWKTFLPNNAKGCGGGCPSCEAKDLLINDIQSNQGNTKNFSQFRPMQK